jgi:hypothetical protein
MEIVHFWGLCVIPCARDRIKKPARESRILARNICKVGNRLSPVSSKWKVVDRYWPSLTTTDRVRVRLLAGAECGNKESGMRENDLMGSSWDAAGRSSVMTLRKKKEGALVMPRKRRGGIYM